MNQKEITAWREAIEDFSKEYDCFSIVENTEEYFSRTGCDCCPDNLAGSVFDVRCITRENLKNKKFNEIEEIELCGSCLSALVNGDFSFLDFYFTRGDQ